MWKPLIATIMLVVAACSPTAADAPTTTTLPSDAPTATATLTTPPGEPSTTTQPPTTTQPATTTTTAAPTTTRAPAPTTTTAPPTSTLPNTAPEIEIISPEHLSAHVASFDTDRRDFGAFVSLSAIVSDPDGDPITVTWSSSTTGVVGTGASIVAFISTNGNDTSQPTLTATATDSGGATATASVQIIVWIPSDT